MATAPSGVVASAAVTTPSPPFPFPFPPYAQQSALVAHVLDTLDRGRGHVAIVESPTGTGKSLSLASACLYWLLERHPAQQRAAESAASAAGRLLPDWVGAQTAAKVAATRAEAAAKESALRDVVAQQSRLLERRAAALEKRATTDEEDDEFLVDGSVDASTGRAPQLSPAQELRIASLLEQQEAEAELLHAADTPLQHKIRLIFARVERSAEIKRLSLGQQGEDEVGDLLARLLKPDKPRRRPQIIFASRTHSQLLQMVGEIKKLKYGRSRQEERRRQRASAVLAPGSQLAAAAANSTPRPPSPCSARPIPSPHEQANAEFDPLLQAKVVSLGSRSNLCIRPQFAHLRAGHHSLRLNDACLDLQKKKASGAAAAAATASKAPTAAGCEFLSGEALPIFHDHALAEILDLEQLVAKGEQLHCCPYYGSRHASPEADMLLVPYASLLSAKTRAALQIELEDAVIVIDEAHNLHDTINDIHSCRLSARQLRDTRAALNKYLHKFRQRLAPVNQHNLELLLRICDAFLLALQHSHAEAHRQAKEEFERGSAFAAHRGSDARQLNDIFSDGVKDSVHAREAALKQAQAASAPAATGSRPVVGALLAEAASRTAGPHCSYSLIKSITHFNASLGLADINYHHVEAWVERSDLCNKIKGYIDRLHSAEQAAHERDIAVRIHAHQQRRQVGGKGAASMPPSPAVFEASRIDAPYESTSISPLTPVLEFIKALNNTEGDGRVCVDIRVDGVASQLHPESSLRFLMLNPSVHLLPLLRSARTLILAGGTMQPFDSFKYQLFPVLAAHEAVASDAPPEITTAALPAPPVAPPVPPVERLHFFSCGHVIPPSHIQALILRSGPGLAKTRPFNFQSSLRSEWQRLDDLAATLVNLVNVIPQGVIVFFTSYAFAKETLDYWSTHASKDRRVYESERAAAAAAKAATVAQSGRAAASPLAAPPLPPATWLERIRKKKVVFRDSQGSSFEEILVAYTRVIQQCSLSASHAPPASEAASASATAAAAAAPAPSEAAASSSPSGGPLPSFTDSLLQAGQTGAILFSVVGGKMSEGINFSDGLARGVVMVGLPYPNARDPEMREKMAYADRAPRAALAAAAANSAGRQLLNTLCMRAVNQSIGRAIRHARDFASILLLDERYLQPEVEALLPRWIKTDSFRPAGVDFAEGFKAVSAFFQDKKRLAAAPPPAALMASLPRKRKAEEAALPADTTATADP